VPSPLVGRPLYSHALLPAPNLAAKPRLRRALPAGHLAFGPEHADTRAARQLAALIAPPG